MIDCAGCSVTPNCEWNAEAKTCDDLPEGTEKEATNKFERLQACGEFQHDEDVCGPASLPEGMDFSTLLSGKYLAKNNVCEWKFQPEEEIEIELDIGKSDAIEFEIVLTDLSESR